VKNELDAKMNLDIRIPIGGMFSILGVVLLIFGLLTHGHSMYMRSLGININIWWGLALLVFGGAMLFLGVRTRPGAASPAVADPEQLAQQKRKHDH